MSSFCMYGGDDLSPTHWTKLKAAGVDRTADDVMEDMRHLHSVLMLREGGRKAERHLGIPTKTQAEVLSAFGVFIDAGGVLRPSSR